MKVEVRKELSIDNANLNDISARDKIFLALKSKYQESKIYRNNQKKKMDAAQKEKLRRIGLLKEELLFRLYAELSENMTLKSRDLRAKTIHLIVKQKYDDILDEVLSHKEFLPYDIVRVPENRDIRTAFPTMPIILECSKKTLGEVQDEI